MPIGTTADMSLNDLIREIEAHAEGLGLSPDLLCRRATGNPRLFQRLKRRQAQTERDAAAVRRYVAELRAAAEPDEKRGAA